MLTASWEIFAISCYRPNKQAVTYSSLAARGLTVFSNMEPRVFVFLMLDTCIKQYGTRCDHNGIRVIVSNLKKLDESTARRHLKSPRSLSGRSIHLTLVTKWSWSWSWMTYCYPLCAMWIGLPILGYGYFKIWPWKSMAKVMCVVKGQGHVWPSKFKGQGYGKDQTHWSHLRPEVQSIYLLSWQSDHFWLRYREFHIWPKKIKVKVMAKVKPDGRIWGLGVQSMCLLSFRGNRTIFGWAIANSIFDLENSRSRSWPRSNPMVTFEP